MLEIIKIITGFIPWLNGGGKIDSPHSQDQGVNGGAPEPLVGVVCTDNIPVVNKVITQLQKERQIDRKLGPYLNLRVIDFDAHHKFLDAERARIAARLMYIKNDDIHFFDWDEVEADDQGFIMLTSSRTLAKSDSFAYPSIHIVYYNGNFRMDIPNEGIEETAQDEGFVLKIKFSPIPEFRPEDTRCIAAFSDEAHDKAIVVAFFSDEFFSRLENGDALFDE